MNYNTSQKKIVAFRGDGLGGRLQNLLYSWHMSRSVDAQLYVFWPDVPGGMGDIFGEDYRLSNIIDIFSTYLRGLDKSILFIDGHPPSDFGTVDRIDKRPHWRKYSARGWTRDSFFGESDTVVYNSYYPLFLKGEDLAAVNGGLSILLNRLVFHEKIRALLEGISGKYKLTQCVGLHYRRGDITIKLAEEGVASIASGELSSKLDAYVSFYLRKCAPASAYVKAIASLDRGSHRFAVFSDDREATDLFREELGTSLIDLSNVGKSLKPIQTAFLEMMLLSRCGSIVTTNSGFSQTANLISGVPLSYAKNFCTPDEMLGEMFSIMGFTDPTVDRDLRAKAVDLVLSNARYKVVAQELGWNLEHQDVVAILDSRG